MSYTKDVLPALSVQGDLFWQQFKQDIDDFQASLIIIGNTSTPLTQRTLASVADTRAF